MLLLTISEIRNCSSVGCPKCVQFHNNWQGCWLTIFQRAQRGKSQKVRSPTGNVLGAAAKI